MIYQALKIRNLAVSIGQKSVLQSIDLEALPGSVHALMGPNGSGKSTLAYALMGHPAYRLTAGSIDFNGADITAYPLINERKREFSWHFKIPWKFRVLPFLIFLKKHIMRQLPKKLSPQKNSKNLFLRKWIFWTLIIAFASSKFNAGFSGGEKKRLELLQLLVLKPAVAILDELDSGLDVDAIKIVAAGLQVARHSKSEYVHHYDYPLSTAT